MGLISYLTRKFEYLGRYGQKLSHIPEMNITFTADLRNMTFAHYLEQLKQMIEWTLIKKTYRNSELSKMFGILPLPPIIQLWEWET